MTQSLIYGSELTQETFNEFLERLHYQHRGDGSMEHTTSNPVFQVTNRVKKTSPFSVDSNDDCMFIHEGTEFDSKEQVIQCLLEYFEYLNDTWFTKHTVNNLLCLDNFDFVEIINEHYSLGVELYNYIYEQQTVSVHLTREAAQIWIDKNKHGYCDLSIFVDCAHHSWELNAVINGLLDGKIAFIENRKELFYEK